MIQEVTEFIDEVISKDGHGSIVNILRGAVVTRVILSPPQLPSLTYYSFFKTKKRLVVSKADKHKTIG